MPAPITRPLLLLCFCQFCGPARWGWVNCEVWSTYPFIHSLIHSSLTSHQSRHLSHKPRVTPLHLADWPWRPTHNKTNKLLLDLTHTVWKAIIIIIKFINSSSPSCLFYFWRSVSSAVGHKNITNNELTTDYGNVLKTTTISKHFPKIRPTTTTRPTTTLMIDTALCPAVVGPTREPTYIKDYK